MINGLDIGTGSLSLANIEIPEYMEGKNMFDDTYKRKYVISTRDRCDFTIDRIRSVRSKDYKYIRNFLTDRPYTQPTYMDVDGIDFVKTMHQLHADKKLNAIQDRFMSDVRPEKELYNLKDDPFELNNLADKYVFASDINRQGSNILVMRIKLLKSFLKNSRDHSMTPEQD